MKIDSHQHFWDYNPEEYPWMQGEKMNPIRRNFGPGDLERVQSKVGLDGSIAVQARQSLKESRWLLELAAQDARIKGVVGWVDLRSESVEAELEELSQNEKFVGVRHVVHDEPDDEFMLRPEFLRGLGKLHGYGMTYDLLLFPKHLPVAVEVVKKFPEQPFVLDHIAKPHIKDGGLSPWYKQIAALAAYPNVYCKVSGMVTEAAWRAWNKRDFRPYLDVVFDAFGEDRLMFGSDWPVCLLSADYDEVVQIVTDYLQDLGAGTSEKIMGENAVRFYGVARD
jgi:L-fuconolactonase